MKESIQKLVNTTESIESDANNGANKDNIKTSVNSIIPLIEMAKQNPLNSDYEELLNDLGNRLGKVLLIIK
tara:strand:- start:117 stop:329 length:213 start_codon:yes stop_codon:yes gene_type:complete